MQIIWKLRLWLLRHSRHTAGGIYYIGGSDVLPPPLDAARESEAVSALSEGKAWARDTLIEHNLRLVVYIARKFENTGVGAEDLI